MNVFAMEPPSLEAGRRIAANLYRTIRGEHGWGERFVPEPSDDVLDYLGELAPRDMRRALMTGFGNARLDHRDSIATADPPKPANQKVSMGFIQ